MNNQNDREKLLQIELVYRKGENFLICGLLPYFFLVLDFLEYKRPSLDAKLKSQAISSIISMDLLSYSMPRSKTWTLTIVNPEISTISDI